MVIARKSRRGVSQGPQTQSPRGGTGPQGVTQSPASQAPRSGGSSPVARPKVRRRRSLG